MGNAVMKLKRGQWVVPITGGEARQIQSIDRTKQWIVLVGIPNVWFNAAEYRLATKLDKVLV